MFLRHVAKSCHRNFGPGNNGPRTKIFNETFGPPGPVFPKILVHIENFGPGVQYSTQSAL